MQLTSLAAVAALLAQNAAAQNMLRFACSQLVVERTAGTRGTSDIVVAKVGRLGSGEIARERALDSLIYTHSSPCSRLPLFIQFGSRLRVLLHPNGAAAQIVCHLHNFEGQILFMI